MDYDPSQYLGSAPHYLIGRPPYSAELADVVARELELDGSGHLLDVGCGPGVLAVQLAPLFELVTAIDPDPDMIAEARRHATAHAVTLELRRARAEDIGMLDLPPMRVVTFGQSFHRVSRTPVAETVYDLLEPGGAIVLVSHDINASPAPTSTGDPSIPDQEVQELITRYLGPDRRSGLRPVSSCSSEPWEVSLAKTRFGEPATVHAPGRRDVTRDVDGIISGYLSMSYAAPHLFGDRLGLFVDDLRSLLIARTETGRFWDWPGETAALIARKPSRTWDLPIGTTYSPR
ncbi:methyltransferase family protein [Antricoccus suffuscus]|uniref:Methyltransferase family protein n=1 Tax=Antricoccus suffuscus TaxID=1629062 RepID=A0A2T1A2J6_9ACTN|nr:class I SAM-dependent methyltransferase [Antricoccus suffuscus]PRZ42717.1 methyltransferase family protein [Antricoccus suffuscus]